jgi:hypothetical protein
MPDVAQVRFLNDRPPWDDHEVVCYYLDKRMEIAFARAYILGRPDIQLTRSEKPLTDRQIAMLRDRPHLQAMENLQVASASTSRMGPGERAEAAARRAEQAAGRVEAAATTAERAATRAEVVVAKMATRAPAKRR